MKPKKRLRKQWRRTAVIELLMTTYLYGEIEEVADQIMRIFKRRRK